MNVRAPMDAYPVATGVTVLPLTEVVNLPDRLAARLTGRQSSAADETIRLDPVQSSRRSAVPDRLGRLQAAAA